MQYLNLALTVRETAAGSFDVSAHSDTMGEAADRLALPLTPDALADAQGRLAGGRVDEAYITELGAQLNDALFAGRVRDLYRECLGEVHRDDERGLRIRLCIESPAIAALPWEVAYDRNRDVFLATSTETPLTRYINVHEPIDELRTAPPVSVLVAIPDGSGLDVAMERATVEDALLELGDAVRVTVLDGRVTRAAISRALQEQKHHVFHFIGHGEFDGSDGRLILNAEGGLQEDPISARSFAGFFRDYPSMKLIVLNACQGAAVSRTLPLAGIAPQLVRAGIPAVVAMQYPFPDRAALVFAREFYLKLCAGGDRGRVDAAISHARNRLCMDFEGSPAFATPVLYMRSPTGVIFDLEGPRPRRLLAADGDEIHRLREVKRAHQANIAAHTRAGADAAGLAREGEEIAAIDRRLRGYYLTLAALIVVPWFVLLASWIGLFNVIRLDDALEMSFVRYMDGFVAAPVDDRLSVILASGDPAGNGSLGATGSPEWRCHHAALLDGLSGAGAAVVGFDLFFEAPSDCDEPFAAAIARARTRGTRVVLGARRYRVEEGLPRPVMAPVLAAEVGDAWGMLEGDADSRRIRLAAPLIEDAPVQIDQQEAAVVPSFALRTLIELEARDKGRAVTAAADGGRGVLVVRDADRRLLKTVPVADAAMNLIVGLASRDDLAPADYREVHANASRPDLLSGFEGRVVIVGYATADDQLSPAEGDSPRRYGAELQASAVSDLLRGTFTRPLRPVAEYAFILMMAGAGAFIGWRFSRRARGARRAGRAARNRGLRVPVPLIVAVAVYGLVVFLMYKQYRLIPDISYHLVSLLLMYATTAWVRRGGAAVVKRA